MSKTIVYAIHGFLGQSADWSAVKNFLLQDTEKQTVQFFAPDLFSPDSSPILELEDYVDHLASEIEEKCENYENRIFVGYSMGGRLGLHLLNQHPELFDHSIFLSTNPGLPEQQGAEKNKRLFEDMKWAQQITEAQWSSFCDSWNKQGVFENSKLEPVRDQRDYKLESLKRALVMWSLGQQDYFADVLQDESEYLTWAVGEQDSKYSKMAEDLKQKKILLDYKRIPSSGHRILFDQPQAVSDLIKQVLK